MNFAWGINIRAIGTPTLKLGLLPKVTQSARPCFHVCKEGRIWEMETHGLADRVTFWCRFAGCLLELLFIGEKLMQ